MGRAKSLCDRLKNGELYVVFGGFDHRSMQLACFGDPGSNPPNLPKGSR